MAALHIGSERARRKRRTGGKIVATLTLALTSTLLALFMAELAARTFFPLQPPMRFRDVQKQLASTLAREYGYGKAPPGDGRVRELPFHEIFEADPELFWRFAPNVRLSDDHWPLFGVISNGQGLREDHEIVSPKPEGELRILFIGDSCTFGLLLAHGQTVAHLSERALRTRFPGVAIETLNAGVPAYSLFQGWRLLETRAAALAPDLVVVGFGWNGMGVWDGLGDVEHYEHWKAAQPRGPFRGLRLYQMAWKLLGEKPPPPSPGSKRPRLRRDEYRDLLGKVRDSTQRLGADLLLILGAGRSNLAPEPGAENRTPLQNEALYFARTLPPFADGEAPLIDTIPLVRALGLPAEDLYFDGIHPTELTNRVIAEEVVERLAAWLPRRIDNGKGSPGS